MGNEKAENWATTIIHHLERRAICSEKDTKEIHQTILSIVSNSYKVNTNVASIMSGKLGLE